MAQLVVGISDLKVAQHPDTLITYALGSCVGICLLDAAAGVGGLSHIMLPTSSVAPNDKNLYKFADTAIPELIKQMERKGALRSRIKAKIAGGAQMFEIKVNPGGDANIWKIGQRNVTAVTDMLRKLSIPIMAQDVLANYGRTVMFNPATGVVSVRALNRELKDI